MFPFKVHDPLKRSGSFAVISLCFDLDNDINITKIFIPRKYCLY